MMVQRGRRCASCGERGVSLIETLVAVSLLGIAVVAIVAGFRTILDASEVARGASSASVVARNTEVFLEAAPYLTCGTAAGYQGALTDGFTAPSGSTVTVTGVQYWKTRKTTDPTPPTDTSAEFWSTCYPTKARPVEEADNGLQQITYEVSTRSGEKTLVHTRTFLKRFDGAYPEARPDGTSCTISSPAQVDATFVNEVLGKRDTNYSTEDHMDMLYLDGSRRFSYLRFEVAPDTTCDEGNTLGSGHIIVGARLRLYTYNIAGQPACGANSCWHALERVKASSGPWTLSDLTWNTQPCPTSGRPTSCRDDDANGTLFEHGPGAFNWSARYQTVESDQLTEDVKAFYEQSAPNDGWVIKEACAEPYGKSCGTISPGFQMRTDLAVDPSQRPRLQVIYQ